MRLEGRTIRGRAVLEQHELIVRGKNRVVIPINAVTSAVAENGTLTLQYGATIAVLEIGPAAEKWAKRITHPPSRLDKLGAKPGLSALVTGVRHEDLVTELEAHGLRVTKTARRAVDLIFFGSDSRETLGRLSDLRHKLKPEGALWVIRPKGSTAVTESEVMAAGKRAGLVDVKVVSFSPMLTAEKFVIPRAAR